MIKFQSIMLVMVAIIGVRILFMPLIGKAALKSHLKKDVSKLFSLSGDISHKTFSYKQLEGLPIPVQRYFRYALDDGQSYISYVRLKHTGTFKPAEDKKWTGIKGQQYFTAETPGFLWKGKTSLFTARDMYIGGKGRLVVSLFSLFKVVDEQGEHIDQAELLRWLGESVWFPTNLLPGENLQWTAIDSAKAKVTCTHNGISVYYIVHFNEHGQITKLETERYMEKDRLEKWIGIVGDYKQVDGIRIPTYIEGKWDLEEGEYPYAKFHIQQIEYNIPHLF